MLAQLDENSAGRRRMQERDTLTFGAWSRAVIDQPDSLIATPVQGRIEVIHRKTDMVDTRTAFGEELPDG
jgi:hypothetical protein